MLYRLTKEGLFSPLNWLHGGEYMTNEELIDLYQKGDKSALETLVEQNKGLVYKIANSFYTQKTASIDEDDLIQEGFTGLIIAAQKYNSNLENAAKFSTYAVFWIRQKISRFLHQKNTNEETSLNKPVSEEDGTGELIDFIADERDSYGLVLHDVYVRQLHDELEQIMDKYCTLQQREIIKMRFGWDGTREMTFREIAEIFDLSHARIRDIQNTAFRKMSRTTWGERIKREKRIEERYRRYDSNEDLIWDMEAFNERRKALKREIAELKKALSI